MLRVEFVRTPPKAGHESISHWLVTYCAPGLHLRFDVVHCVME